MFELELHDLIPYLISISLLYTLAYSYASHLNSEACWYVERSRAVTPALAPLPLVLLRVIPLRHWLVRKVKRKESPDDDISNCSSSFVTAFSNKRGGFRCSKTMCSLPLNTAVPY